MNYLRLFSLAIFSSLLVGCAIQPQSRRGVHTVDWQSLTEVSPGNGNFAKGVSACFAGYQNGSLIIAGGCNFPDVPAAEGGKKIFYDDIYAAHLQNDTVQKWERIGNLPAPLAYGVSVSTPKGLVCVGGITPDGPTTMAYRLEYNSASGNASVHKLTPLPNTVDNMTGALVGNTLYIVGGNVDKKPSSRMFALNLNSDTASWQKLTPVPGKPRVQPVCAAIRKNGKPCLILTGGFAGAFANEDASLSTDAYCFEPETCSWVKIATPVGTDGKPLSLGGGVAVTLDDSLMLCMGGVNKDIFLKALQREQALKKAVAENNQKRIDELREDAKKYMKQPVDWYKFNKEVLIYSPVKDSWTSVGSFKQTARAGAAAVSMNKVVYLFFGELKPGIRTPQIWKGKVD